MSRPLARLSKAPEAAGDVPSHVERILHQRVGDVAPFLKNRLYSNQASAVLFLLGRRAAGGGSAETCLILNKRSQKVRQPGDLCCPGGGIIPWLDRHLARLLSLRGAPLSRWAHWSDWRSRRSNDAFDLALLLATGLRESFEEMRLNPLGVRFLGVLPVQRLVMFRREIYPFACWVSRQRRFYPNWEVEKIVTIPLNRLLEPANYARYRLIIDLPENHRQGHHSKEIREFPCFLHNQDGRTERLWGATFWITMNYLKWVYGFEPPNIEDLKTIEGRLDRNYAEGRK